MFFSLRLSNGAAKLVGATGALSSAIDALKALQHFLAIHATDKGTDALKVSMATADETCLLELSVFYLHADEP